MIEYLECFLLKIIYVFILFGVICEVYAQV